MTGVDPADAWLASLPSALARQKTVLSSFLALARTDERIRLFVVGCSIGRGAADELSDVDAMLAVRGDAWDESLSASRSWVERTGPVLDLWQTLPQEFRGAQHTYALYENGVELDLSLFRISDIVRPRADWVVLHDPDRTVTGEPLPRTAAEIDVRDWTYRVLTRLAAVAKYVRRSALWEAQYCLELARADLWRIWDVAEAVPDPQYGLTAAFDDPRRPVPPRFDRTIAALESRSLANAAVASLDMLVATWPEAMRQFGRPDEALPPLAASVRERLRNLAT